MRTWVEGLYTVGYWEIRIAVISLLSSDILQIKDDFQYKGEKNFNLILATKGGKVEV